MAKKKILTAKTADEEEKKKVTAKVTTPATIANATKKAIQTATEAKASSPVSASTSYAGGIVELVKKKAAQNAARQAAALPTVSQNVQTPSSSLRNKTIQTNNGIFSTAAARKYFDQALRYAQYSPQAKTEMADSLLGFDIGDYNGIGVENLDWDILRALGIRNEMYKGWHQGENTFDAPEYLTADSITLPSTEYITNYLPGVADALEKSKKKDEEMRTSKEKTADQEIAWQNVWKAVQEEKTEFDEWYNLLMIDHLLNNSDQLWDFEAADARYGEDVMDDATYDNELKRLREQKANIDWTYRTGAQSADYQSQTEDLQAMYDLLSGESTRRSRVEELGAIVRENPNYGQPYTPPQDERKLTGNRILDAWNAVNPANSKWNDKTRFINEWNAYRESMKDVKDPNKLTEFLRNFTGDIGNFFGYGESADAPSAAVENYIAEALHYMTPDMVAEYNALLEMDPSLAEEYLEATRADRLRIKADVEAEYYQTRAEDPLYATIDTLGSFINQPFGMVNTVIGAVTGETDPNAAIYGPSRQVDVTRQTAGELAGKMFPVQIFGEEAGTIAYNIFTSIGDMLVAKKIGSIAGGLTGKMDAAQKVMGAVMATESGTSTYMSDLQEGKDPLYAATHGMADGLIEAWSESGFIDSLFNEKGKFISRVWKSAASEGLEEEFSQGMQMANDLFMSWLTGQKSDIEKTYEYYVAAVGKDKAAKATMQHYANEFAIAGLSGTVSGAGTSAVVNVGTEMNNRATGKQIRQKGDPDRILSIAVSMQEGTESKRIGDEVTARMEKNPNKGITNYELGQLTGALARDLGEEKAKVLDKVQDEAIENRLIELGDDPGTAKKNAPAIRKLTRGQKLTLQERAAVAWNDHAEQVVKELSRETQAEDLGRTGNKWVTGMKSAQIDATGEITGKQFQLGQAMTTPSVGESAKRAEEKAQAKRQKVGGKFAGKPTSTYVSFTDAQGKQNKGNILRVEDGQEGLQAVVQTGKEEQRVPLSALDIAEGEGIQTILEYIGDENLPHSMTGEEANLLLQTYKASGGGSAKTYIEGFEKNYTAGYSGIEEIGGSLEPTLAKLAYEHGKAEAEKDEKTRKARASEYKALVAPTAGWLGKVTSNAQVNGTGDEAALEGALEAMPEMQRTAAEIMIESGKALGVNVVLFESDGEIGDIQNGSFDAATHTVYYDVNAGANTAKDIQAMKDKGTLGYALMRVGGHELTHYLEAGSPEAYAKYVEAVKTALKSKGQDFAVLMREQIDKAQRAGRKLSMQGAVAEVVADASEYMLQDSKFTNNLDTTLKGKIKTFIQNFAQKIKDIFRQLAGGHKESAALREMKNGVYHYLEGLQELWDAGFDEILEKGTTDQSGDATEMVEGQGVKFSPRDYGLDNLNDETVSNIQSRGQYIVTSREDLMQHVETALAGKAQETVFIGAIPDATKKSLEEETGVSIFRPLEYAYGISYDCIRHIRKHFTTSEEVADAIETVFSMIDDHDSVEVIRRKDGGINLMFKKGYDAIEVESVALTSNRTRTLTVKTAYISRVHEKGAKINQAATFQSTGSSRLDPSSTDSVPQSAANVNPDVKNSDRDTADQTETEAFKRWFGDSVVVNRDGTPKVMYHGTTRGGFTVFDGGKDYYYFTDNRKYAYTFAGRKANGQYYPSTKEAEAEGRKKSQIYKVYLSVQNPYITDDVDIIEDALYWDKTLAQKLRDKGYDALMLPDMSQVIVLNPSQIKSATDNVGTFDPANPDIRYSDRDLPDGVTIREYLGSMKPTSSMTETEKLLLKRYQDQLRTLEEKEKLVEAQEEIIRTAPFRNPDGSLNDEITKAKNRYKIYRDQANRAARALANAEKDEGFARLMATSRQVVNDYLLGAAGNVADAQDVLESEINELTRQLTKLEADVTRTSQGQRTAFARGLYNPDDLKAAAQKLKDTYGSRMSVQNIANRLALAYGELYANDGAEGGKMFMAATRDLATDLLAGNKYRYQSEILPMLREQIGTISLSDTDLQEIGNAGLTVTEYKRVLSPYIKVSAEGSDLSSYASNAEYYGNGALASVLSDENEGNLAMRLYDVISQEKAKEADNGYDGMSESQLIGMAMADIAGANLPMSANSSTVEYLRKELLKYAGENAEVAITVEEAISKAKKATAKAGRIWLEAAKNTETARQAVEYYRALDEKRRVMELAEQKKQITEQLKSDTAKKLQEKVTAQREEYREREKKAREYRKTRDEVDKLHSKISRNVKRLNSLRVRETDQKHVPQELQHVADAVMSTFTESELGRLAFHEAKLMNLARTYRLLRQSETDAAYFWDDEIETDINNLQALGEAYGALRNREGSAPSRFSLEGVELETEILQGVDAIVSHVLNMIDATNTGFLYQRNETFAQFANKAGEKLRGHKDYKNLKGALGRIQHMLDESLRTGNTTPVYFFEHLENQEIMDVFDEIRKGMRQAAIIEREGKQFIEKAREQYNYGSWVADGKLTMKTGQGHTIELTREEAAEIYAIAKREAANKLYQTEHLLYGGFQYKNIAEKLNEDGKTQQKNTPHQLDKADIARIGEWLTAEQKAYADELVGFLSTTMADYGNQASMDMYGYKKFTEQYYIPFHTSAEQRFLKGDEGPQGENAGTGRVKNSGFTKKLQHKANQTLLVGGISDTVADHIHKMAAYAAMVQPIENMKRLLNHQVLENDGTSNTIRALIGQKYGQAAQDYLMQLLKDANGATMSDHRASGLTDKLVGAFKRGAVMASASVVLQQPTAMARAMAYINPKHFANNPFYRPSKGTWDELMKYSGTAVIKDMGKFDVGMGLTATQYILDENLSAIEAYRRLKDESKTKAGKAVLDRFMNWLTAAPGVADQWTWGLIWKAVKAEQAEMHPEMDKSSEAFLNLCGARFDDVIDHTQVYDSVLTRSDLMRSTNSLHKMATSFMSEPTLSLNMLYDALTGKHTGKQRGAIIGGVVASQVLAGALAALVQAWNDDDDERNWLEKYADRATGNVLDNLNPLGMIPYVSDIISIFEGYDVERPDMSVITDIYNYSKKFVSSFENGSPTWKETENFVGTLANLLGIPAKNISREVRRTWNMITKTDWSVPDAFGVGQAVMGNLPGYSVNKTTYYQRITTALIRGETQLAEDYKAYMLASQGVDEDKLTQGIRTAYKDAYEKGGIDKDAAIAFLLENNLVTGDTEEKRKQSAFQYVDKWEEGTDGYSAYNTLKDAYAAINFSEIEKAWKELTNNGYTDKQVKEQSRTLLKKLVQDGSITTGQATQLLKKWCQYAKDSDNTDKPKEWLKTK